MMNNFTTSVYDVIGDHTRSIVRGVTPDQEKKFDFASTFDYDPNDDDERVFPWSSELADISPYDDTNEKTLEDINELINVHFQMMNDEGVPVLVKVKGRKRDQHGNPIGEKNPNPILDTRVFNTEYSDGRIEEVSTNLIAKSLFSEVHEDGFNTAILNDIIDIKKDDSIAVSKEEGYVESNGQRKPVITTKGWDIQVKWTDGTTDWIPLTSIRNSDPVRVAKFAVARGVDTEPPFNWWVRKVLRKRDRLISKVKSRCRMSRPRMKFGVIIPKDVDEALKLDERNGNTYWEDTI